MNRLPSHLDHDGYAAVVDGVAVGSFDSYEEAFRWAGRRGIVIRTCDIERYGYENQIGKEATNG
jgi:hypothetical protein